MKKTALLLALVICITSVEAVRADSTQSYDDYTAYLEENLNQKYTLDEALEIIENESSLDSYVEILTIFILIMNSLSTS